jgi:hypothetical protein
VELAGVLLGLFGIAAAIYIPLKIEALKRPKLRIEWAADANNSGMFGGPTRITHVAVVNEPIEGWPGRWLLRNPASGCQVKLTYRSRSDEETLSISGKWSAKPEPLQWLPVQKPDGSQGIYQYADTEKLPDMLVYDVSPGRRGGVVAVALKRDGERQAYAFGWMLYAALPEGPLADDSLELPHDAYEVTVEAEAGGIECSATFLLHNDGDHHTGLHLDRDPLPGDKGS